MTHQKSLVCGHSAKFSKERVADDGRTLLAGYFVSTHLLAVQEGEIVSTQTKASRVLPGEAVDVKEELRQVEACSPVGLDIVPGTVWNLKMPEPKFRHPTEFTVLGWFCAYATSSFLEVQGRRIQYPPQVIPCLVGERMGKNGQRVSEVIRLIAPGDETAFIDAETDVIDTIADTYAMLRETYPFLSKIVATPTGRSWVFESIEETHQVGLEEAAQMAAAG